jgi:hypothetical protein
MATVQEMLDAVDTAISGLVTTQQVDYKIGDKSVSAGQKMEQLIKLRKLLLETPDAEIGQMAFDIDITEFGEDDSQYED